MATTHTLIPISAANISFHPRLRLPSPPPPFSWSPSLLIKCSINAIGDTESSKNLINNNVRFNNLILSGPAAKQLDESCNGLDKNAERVEAEIQNQENEIAELSEAENGVMVTKRKAMNKSKEKMESLKAAFISAIVGTLASLPISLIHKTNAFDLTVSTATTVIACALYGATFRYTIRRDLDDFHLKTGTSAAFGIVKGVATLDGRPDLEHEGGSLLLSQAFGGAVCVSENVVIFLVAAAGLDICYKMGILSPFPVERSVSRTKM